jgi:transposase-like protein
VPRRKITADDLERLLTDYVTTDVTQSALAAKYGITQAHVSTILHDPERHGPRAADVAAAHARARGRRASAADPATIAAEYAAGGVTQAALAARHGLSQSRVARILAARGVPSTPSVRAAARRLEAAERHERLAEAAEQARENLLA